MSQAVRFTPVYGTLGNDIGGPICCHLEIGSLNILLDCGWTDVFDLTALENLRTLAPRIDAVLISHSDMNHMGALPYAYSKLGLRAPVICTAPVHKLGMMLLYDQYLSRQSVSNFGLFNLDDIDAAFENCVDLKFLEPHSLDRPGGSPVVVTPYSAGHMLGGAIWKITIDSEDLLYAAGINHRSERLLNGTALDKFLRPQVLVADCATALLSDLKRKQRDGEVGRAIQECFGGGGSVLMPVDAAGRALELMVLLDEFWAANALEGYGLVLLTHESVSTVEYAKGLLEWMSDAAAKSFEDNRSNPFNFKYLKLCRSKKEMQEMCPGQKAVLASPASLASGFSRELFAEWAGDIRNTILFTSRAPPASLSHSLLSQDVKFLELYLIMTSKVPLEGEELEVYHSSQEGGVKKEKRKREEEKQARGGPDHEPSSSGEMLKQAGKRRKGGEVGENEDGVEGKAVQSDEAAGLSDADKGVAEVAGGVRGISTETGECSDRESQFSQHRLNSVFEGVFFEGFTPDYSAACPMFPSPGTDKSQQQKHMGRWDAYGELINLDDFRISKEPQGQILAKTLSAHKGGLEREVKVAAQEFQDLISRIESPCKVIERQLTLTLAAHVKFVDYEGLSDGKALANQIQQVSPHKLILVHGSEEASLRLRQMCEQKRVCLGDAISVPSQGQSIVLTSEFATLKFRLSDELLQTTKFHQLPGGFQVAWIEGLLMEIPDDVSKSQAEPSALPTEMNTLDKQDSQRAIETEAQKPGEEQEVEKEDFKSMKVETTHEPQRMLAPRPNVLPALMRPGLLIGDPKMADLRILLHANGIKAEFGTETGLLRCGDSIAIRKMPGSGRLVLDGSVSKTFSKIRELIYSQFIAL